MHVKFIARGTGSTRAAADYLLGERDAAGQVRDGVEVLRGDPEQVAAVADALEFEHKYTSGVIAWAPEDRPTDAQIEAVLDKFEQTAWAGLAPDRYAWTAVEHRERGGGVHVHVLAARCDLETGKSLNIAPPGWQKTFGPLRDAFNHEHGWSRPDDPARARTQQPGHRAYIDAANLRAGLAVEANPRELIRDYLVQRVEHGVVRDRAEVVAALQEAGLDVPRQGKSYVTAHDPESGKRWRLKGALYEQGFNPERLDGPAATAVGDRPQGDRADRSGEAAAAWRELERRREQRAAFHRSRFGGVGRTDQGRAERRVAPDHGGGPERLGGYLRRRLGGDAMVVDEHREPARRPGDSQPGRRADPPDLGAVGGDGLAHRVPRNRRRAVRRVAGWLDGVSALDRGRAACREAVERVRELYDRTGAGTAAVDGLSRVVQAVRDGTAAALRAGRGLAAALRAAGRGEQDLAAANRAALGATEMLGRGLQDARRDVARAVEMIRHQRPQRGPERDHGPSR